MTDILLTNDDGYKSPAFVSLAKTLAADFAVVSVAPVAEKSWIGKSITADRELKLEKRQMDGLEVFALDGTPADCAQVGLYNVLDEFPKMLVSGVNLGLNSGTARILSSGTIGAAAEAAFAGVKAIASSFDIPPHAQDGHGGITPAHFDVLENISQVTAKVVRIFLNCDFNGFDLVTVNIPFEASLSSEFQVTSSHTTPYGRLFHGDKDRFSHQVPPIEFGKGPSGTDLNALAEGKVSITPLSLDLTSGDCFDSLDGILAKAW